MDPLEGRCRGRAGAFRAQPVSLGFQPSRPSMVRRTARLQWSPKQIERIYTQEASCALRKASADVLISCSSPSRPNDK